MSVAPTLEIGCYYGGSPIGAQQRQLRKGVDVVVGTPGRVIDLIDQNSLDLGQVRAPGELLAAAAAAGLAQPAGAQRGCRAFLGAAASARGAAQAAHGAAAGSSGCGSRHLAAAGTSPAPASRSLACPLTHTLPPFLPPPPSPPSPPHPSLQIQFVILDEADQMLNVGFEKDVETILENVPAARQTMLFSATMPKWVKKLVKSYLRDPVTVDAVGEGQSGKMADSITALAVQVTDESRRRVLVDVLTVYGEGGKAIVFTQTKREADEVSAAVAAHLPCEALHGDLSQKDREKVLAAFRAGKVSILVATDVAARGLDIPEVDLVVHYELPQDPEGFLHRSGERKSGGGVGERGVGARRV